MSRRRPTDDDHRGTIIWVVFIGWVGIVLSFVGILYVAVARWFFMGAPQ